MSYITYISYNVKFITNVQSYNQINRFHRTFDEDNDEWDNGVDISVDYHKNIIVFDIQQKISLNIFKQLNRIIFYKRKKHHYILKQLLYSINNEVYNINEKALEELSYFLALSCAINRSGLEKYIKLFL